MENSTYLSCNGIPWQSTMLCIGLNFKDKFLAAAQEPRINHQRPQMKLTNEAVCMICFILVFVGFAILGSLITAYEFFFQHKEKKKENVANRRIIKEKKSSEHYDFLEVCKSFLKCFCLVQNGSKILNTTTPEGYIGWFDGLRFLLNSFLTLGHILLLYLNMIRNFNELQYLFDLKVSHIFFSGVLIVDVFLAMSGFLNAQAFFRNYSRSNGNISWFNFYFKRYIRMTPVYMIVVGIYATLFSYTGSGMLWPTYATNPACEKDWWWCLLYINNFLEGTQMCMLWMWYLAIDMQFYIISPLFMVPLIRWPRLGYALILACVSGSGIISYVLTLQYNLIDAGSYIQLHIEDLKYGQMKHLEYLDVINMKPYTRLIPYLLSILLAYYLREKNLNKGKIRNNRMTLWCGWIITIIFMWLSLFSMHKREEIILLTAVYNGTKSLMFSCGFVWIMYLLLTGQLESLNRFLSWKYFLPFSRLNFCAYMIHPTVINWILLQAGDLEDFSYISMIWMFLSVSGITYILSFIITVLFAVPILNLSDWCGTEKKEKISRKEE